MWAVMIKQAARRFCFRTVLKKCIESNDLYQIVETLTWECLSRR